METVSPLPVREESGIALRDPFPPRLEAFEPTQPPVLLARPPHQVGVDAFEKRIHLGPVEPAPVGHPASHDWFDRFREVVQSAVWLPVKPPAADFPAFLGHLLLARCRLKRREPRLFPRVSGRPGP